MVVFNGASRDCRAKGLTSWPALSPLRRTSSVPVAPIMTVAARPEVKVDAWPIPPVVPMAMVIPVTMEMTIAMVVPVATITAVDLLYLGVLGAWNLEPLHSTRR